MGATPVAVNTRRQFHSAANRRDRTVVFEGGDALHRPRTIITLAFLVAGCSKTSAGSPSTMVQTLDNAADIASTAAGRDCLPKPDHGGDNPVVYDYSLARAGGQLTLCATITAKGLFACWNVDATTGALEPQPGVGFSIGSNNYKGLTWPANDQPDLSPGEDSSYIAFHSDGKRAAVLHDMSVSVFDLASKREITAFPLRQYIDGTVAENEIGNVPAGLWFCR
jgi:hypothetical protein